MMQRWQDVFEAIKIHNRHGLSLQIKQPQNSDSRTVNSDFKIRNKIQIAMLHFFGAPGTCHAYLHRTFVN